MTSRLNPGVTAWLCIVLVVGILVAGLWPFSFRPANGVTWLSDRAGLRFEPPALAADPEALQGGTAGILLDEPADFTVELWLEAGREPNNDVFHILTIHDGGVPSNFVLCQWKSELLLRSPKPENPRGFREVGATDALKKENPCFIAITGDAAGTAFYLNGNLQERFPRYVLPARMLCGQLILGDDATGRHSWTGKLFGLALFSRALEADEIAQRHTAWMNRQSTQLAAAAGLRALYFFDERNGRLAVDHSPLNHRLVIPRSYAAPHKTVLGFPAGAHRFEKADVNDVVLNILGFVPFGFLFLRYRRGAGSEGLARNLLLVVLAGAALSLLIEIIQVWLPGRVSSSADVLCNAAGAFAGALLAWRVAQFEKPPIDTSAERRQGSDPADLTAV